jgi:fructose-1,6-bisphosphatase/inositol monophosphatase family enzyme
MSKNAPQSDFLRLLEPAMWRAARLARSLEGRVQNVPKLEEDNPAKQALTEADTRTQEILLEALAIHFPGVALAAEEATPSVGRFPTESDWRVVIDPVDGTLHSYLEGRGPYAVIIALVKGGEYEASFVALPREGLLFAGARGEGAFRARAGGPLRPVRAEADGNRILVSHGIPEAAQVYMQARGFEVVPACGGAVAVAPLIRGVRAGLRWFPSSGIGISIRGRAGARIAAQGGACLRAEKGAEFPIDTTTRAETLRVAAREADLELLAEALRVAGVVS